LTGCFYRRPLLSRQINKEEEFDFISEIRTIKVKYNFFTLRNFTFIGLYVKEIKTKNKSIIKIRYSRRTPTECRNSYNFGFANLYSFDSTDKIYLINKHLDCYDLESAKIYSFDSTCNVYAIDK
jgi:hypothetical protein